MPKELKHDNFWNIHSSCKHLRWSGIMQQFKIPKINDEPLKQNPATDKGIETNLINFSNCICCAFLLTGDSNRLCACLHIEKKAELWFSFYCRFPLPQTKKKTFKGNKQESHGKQPTVAIIYEKCMRKIHVR